MITQKNVNQMIEDYIKRSKAVALTIEDVRRDMAFPGSLTYITDNGFIVLQIIDNAVNVIHCYIKPGNTTLLDEFINIASKTAKQFNCLGVFFLTFRPKGFERVLAPHGYKPVGVTFWKGVDSDE